MCAGGGLESNCVHAGDFSKRAFENGDNFETALGERIGLVGMGPGETFGARDKFVDARVVLHGARAERIEAEINGVIPSGEAGEVAQGFELADLGEVFDFGANVILAEGRGGVDRRDVERRELIADFAGGGLLKQERFVLDDVLGDFFDHEFVEAAVEGRREMGRMSTG